MERLTLPTPPPRLRWLPQRFVDTHLLTSMEKGTVRVNILALEHNTKTLSKTPTNSAANSELNALIILGYHMLGYHIYENM